MGRRADITPEQTRARLLEQATRLFAEKGRHHASIREIAKAAGVNSAAIAYHFGDKDGLHTAVVTALYARLGELQALLDPAALADLDGFLSTLWREIYARRDALRVISRDVADRGEMDHAEGWASLNAQAVSAAATVAALTGKPEAYVRHTLISLSYVVSRHAMNHEQELMNVTDTGSIDEAHRAVATHLATLVRRLLIDP